MSAIASATASALAWHPAAPARGAAPGLRYLDLGAAAQVVREEGAEFLEATRKVGRPLYRGEGLLSPARLSVQTPDLEDKAIRSDAEANWFVGLDAVLRERGNTTLSAGQLWVGDIDVAASYGAPCSVWALGPVSCLWLERAKLWWPLARPADAADPAAWLVAQGVRQDLVAGIRSGHEILVCAPRGYVAVPASLDAQLWTSCSGEGCAALDAQLLLSDGSDETAGSFF